MFSTSTRTLPSRSGASAGTGQERPQTPGDGVTSAGGLRTRRIAAAGAVLLAAPVLVSTLHATSAQADSSCTTQITNRVNALQFPNDYYPATLVIQREDNSWTSYSVGSLFRSSTRHLTGASFTQTYSDRTYFSHDIGRYQNFDAAHPDTHSIDLSPTGLLAIHSYTWNANSSADLTCAGGLLTKYDAANRQLLTLTFGPKVSIR